MLLILKEFPSLRQGIFSGAMEEVWKSWVDIVI